METGPIHLGLLKTGWFPSPAELNQDRFESGFLVGSGRVTQDLLALLKRSSGARVKDNGLGVHGQLGEGLNSMVILVKGNGG
ncbi:hypothetical protein V6N13_081186 [Hibiscus sabdariffa]